VLSQREVNCLVLNYISDYVWKIYKKSWALMDVRDHERLVRFLEEDILEKSQDVIEDAEIHLLDDTPEAYVQREIGLKKERRKKTQHNTCTLKQR
jgi:23S rRNA maturation mini-RNase III